MSRSLRHLPVLALLAIVHLSCDKSTSPASTEPDSVAIQARQDSALPTLLESTPTCSTLTGGWATDDTIVLKSSMPGAKIYWARPDVFRNFELPPLKSEYVEYKDPIVIGDGQITAYAITPTGDRTNVAILVAKPDVEADVPKILPEYFNYEYAVDSVSILSTTQGASIYYTTDGTQPTRSSLPYRGNLPLPTSGPVTFRAIAALPGKSPSRSVSVTFRPYYVTWNNTIAYQWLDDRRDHQAYPVVKIGSQTWMAKNLNYSPNDATDLLSTSRYLGAAYSWNAARQTGTNGICPEGWNIPSAEDWRTLKAWLQAYSGLPSDSIGLALRSQPNFWFGGRGTDMFGFRAIDYASATNRFWSRDRDSTDTTLAVLAQLDGDGKFELVRLHPPQDLDSNAYSYVSGGVSRADGIFTRCIKSSP